MTWLNDWINASNDNAALDRMLAAIIDGEACDTEGEGDDEQGDR